ncbi:NAD(P)-dependent oxidoreductase [Rhodovulum sp. 12E13]|uniref:NAD-dependent epimerase/dehydratase family protein n=1 Tax=Rhodovulum sp. 12E13 TaxID=2203891 RepID=UPI001314E6B3|nr:NAD(P)-dependent oxidoreductase [Rhodovulum sp. 12E13]
MRIVMIGGTGFLGYFTCRDLAARGHDVLAAGLAPPAPGTMPDGVTSAICDVETCTDAELASLLEGGGAVLYAAGADGRFSGSAPVIEAYRHHNAAPIRRLVPAMRAAGSTKLVIFGSYYTALARERPELVTLARNPYPLSRQEQMDVAFDLAGDDIGVEVLELPYIFGGAPGRGTLWGFLMDKVAAPGPVPVPGGGTACVTAAQVAAAAAGAVDRTGPSAAWAIGGENLSYRAIYRHFADALGITATLVPADPERERAAAEAQRTRLAEAGMETGYDPLDVARWQEEELFLDPAPAMDALGYGTDDIARAIRETVLATQAHGGQGPACLRKPA